MFLDRMYTGKAMAALRDPIRHEELEKDKNAILAEVHGKPTVLEAPYGTIDNRKGDHKIFP